MLGATEVPERLTYRECVTLPLGTRVQGLAPIGRRWQGTVASRNGIRYIRPDKGCPTGEFAPASVHYNGVDYPVA